MKLVVQKRSTKTKGEMKLLRHRGDIPAILYVSGKKEEPLVVIGKEFHTHLRQIPSGHLPVTLFTLALNGEEISAILKEIQYEPTSYRILHLDFLRLEKDRPITVRVPIACSGETESPGVKLGGFLRQVMRHIPVRCTPNNLPKQFAVDVAALGLGETIRVKDLAVQEGVTLLGKLQDVVAVIAKR